MTRKGKMTTMTNSDASQTGSRRRLGRGVILVCIGAVIAAVVMGALRDPAPVFPAALFAQDQSQKIGGDMEGDYLFFTFRRNLWAVHKPTGRVQFLMFPDGQEQQLVRSRVHQVDQERFPADQARYQLSERNLTNFLWVLNPHSGHAQYIRAGRDGVFEFSEIENVVRRE